MGGCHRCPGFEGENESQLVLQDKHGKVTEHTITRSMARATEVEDCIVFDPTRSRTSFFEIADLYKLPYGSI